MLQDPVIIRGWPLTLFCVVLLQDFLNFWFYAFLQQKQGNWAQFWGLCLYILWNFETTNNLNQDSAFIHYKHTKFSNNINKYYINKKWQLQLTDEIEVHVSLKTQLILTEVIHLCCIIRSILILFSGSTCSIFLIRLSQSENRCILPLFQIYKKKGNN